MGKKRQDTAADFRTKSLSALQKELASLKEELSQLRVAQLANGAASKVARIGYVRKQIARVLTVVNQKARADFRKQYEGKSKIPKQLRAKKTRALRLALTPAQKALKTQKAQTKLANFPQRKFAVKA